MPSAQIDKTASVPPAPGGENKFAARLIQNIRKYHSEGFMAFPVYIELIEKNGRTAKETVFSLKWQEEPVTLEKALRKAAEGRWNCLAVLTGRGQDLLVLDIDVKNGRNGLDFLRQHAIEIPPDTPKTATPSGGIHFYFAYPENLKGKSTRAFKKYGFDLRGDGGLIFAPPSDLTGDRQYEWKVPLRRQLRKPPDALINLINRLPGMEAENDPAAEKLTGGLTLPGISPKQREVFYELLKKADAAPTGQRSEADFAVVAWGIKIGLSREEIFNQIRTVGKFAEKARGGYLAQYFNNTYQNALRDVEENPNMAPSGFQKQHGSGNNFSQETLTEKDQFSSRGSEKRTGSAAEDTLEFQAISTKAKDLNAYVKNKKIICVGGRLYRYNDGFYQNLAKEAVLKEITEGVGAYTPKVKRIYEGLQIFSYREADATNPQRYLNLENGIFDTVELIIKPHSPDILSTVRIPIHYDPLATCEKFKEFLKSSIPNEASRLALQEYLGYALSTDTAHQVALFLIGGGSNGKGVLGKLIRIFFGNENIANLDLSDFSNDNKLASLYGKLINVSTEMSGKISPKDFKIFKQVTSFEEVTGKLLYSDTFTFQPKAKFIFSVNKKPTFPENNHATFRRLLFIDFPNEFSEDKGNLNKNLFNELKTEKEGIFNWCIEGLIRLRSNGKFSRDEYMAEQAEKFRIHHDSVGEFLRGICCIQAGTEILKPELYDFYKIFCNRYEVEPKALNQFGKEIMSLSGISERKSGSNRYYTGVMVNMVDE